MKKYNTLYYFALIALFIGCNSGNKNTSEIESSTVELFNGSDLDAFDIFVADSTINPEHVWYVKDSLIRCEGNPFGFIQTKNEFSNYELNVEWRWPEGEGNSGVFLHKYGKDTIWPSCFEAQLKSGNAGDIITINGTSMDQKKDSTVRRIPKLAESSENPIGEWNRYTISCIGDSISVKVNDVLQNIGTHTTVQSGKIALQSEGAPIEFRNIYLTHFKK